MKVLLCQDVEKLGWLGDVIEVKNGYARNYLLPYGIATVPTDGNIRSLAEAKGKKAEERKLAHVQLERAAEAVEGAEAVIASKANEQGHLFGSVGAPEIAGNLREQGFSVADDVVVARRRRVQQAAVERPTARAAGLVAEPDVVGVDAFPLMVAMSKNPAVRDQMRELAKLNPDFRATVTKELDLLSQKINQSGNRIFGVPEGEEFAPLSIDGVMGSAKTKKSDVLLGQIAKIDDELDGLQVKFNAVSDKQIVGKQAAKIMEKKKKAVVDLLSPQYNALREEASNLGITITPDAINT